MLPTNPLRLATLAMASLVIATPMQPDISRQMALEDIKSRTTAATIRMLNAFECVGQSCLIADTSGSTGRQPLMRGEGASESDLRCIIKYNPIVGKVLEQYLNNPPLAPKQNTTIVSTLLIGLNMIFPVFSQSPGSYSGTCAPNILLFAKGTLEPGEYGITAGPILTTGLPSNWTTAGINYSPDIQGDFCLGLPGGQVATQTIDDAARKCPNSKLFLSGFSQGAMVIRNGLANASNAAKRQVKGVVTLGDPFNGAEIKGYQGPLEVFCNSTDGVCSGNFELGTAHLAYLVNSSISKARQALIEMEHGRGNNSCCSPRTPATPPPPSAWAELIRLNGGKIPLARPGTTVEQWESALANSNGRIPVLAAPNPRLARPTR